MTDKPKAVAVKVGETNPLKRMWSFITRKKNSSPKYVSPDNIPRRLLGKSKQFRLILVIIVVLCITAYLYFSNIPSKNKPITSEKKPQTISELYTTVNDLNSQGKYKEAREIISSSAFASGKDKVLLEGTGYINEKKYQEAIEKFKEAEKTYGLNSQIAGGIAFAAKESGDKKLAVEYYTKQIELLRKTPSTTPISNDADIAYIEYLIKNLRE